MFWNYLTWKVIECCKKGLLQARNLTHLATASCLDLLGSRFLHSVHFQGVWPRSTWYALFYRVSEFGRGSALRFLSSDRLQILRGASYELLNTHALSIDSQNKGGYPGNCVLFWVKYFKLTHLCRFVYSAYSISDIVKCILRPKNYTWELQIKISKTSVSIVLSRYSICLPVVYVLMVDENDWVRSWNNGMRCMSLYILK